MGVASPRTSIAARQTIVNLKGLQLFIFMPSLY
jgi:hypothetical protein